MKINITKKQYIDLITMSRVANNIMGILGDYLEDKPYYKEQSNRLEELETYFLAFAKDFQCDDMVEEWRGEMIMNETISEKFEAIVDDYNEFNFWDSLATEMGKRDFMRSITSDDRKYIAEHDGWLPDRIGDIYETYHKEFEDHGIDRLEIIREDQ